jgi:hypothetical protein
MHKISLFILTLLAGIFVCQSVYSQTSGKLTFTVTTTSSGGYSPKHLIAIWIENNSGNFIKTKVKNSMDNNLDHLALWTSKSGYNVVDAITGPTLTSHGTITLEWNSTSVNGTIVSDGTYNIWIEMAWADSKTTGKTSTSFSFTKGPNPFTSSPPSTTNFSGISIDWTPNPVSPLSIKSTLEPESVSVYPNPVSDYINITFNQPAKKYRIRILNVVGNEIYLEESSISNPGIRTIDLSNYTNGIYFINVQTDNKISLFKILKNK